MYTGNGCITSHKPLASIWRWKDGNKAPPSMSWKCFLDTFSRCTHRFNQRQGFAEEAKKGKEYRGWKIWQKSYNWFVSHLDSGQRENVLGNFSSLGWQSRWKLTNSTGLGLTHLYECGHTSKKRLTWAIFWSSIAAVIKWIRKAAWIA